MGEGPNGRNGASGNTPEDVIVVALAGAVHVERQIRGSHDIPPLGEGLGEVGGGRSHASILGNAYERGERYVIVLRDMNGPYDITCHWE